MEGPVRISIVTNPLPSGANQTSNTWSSPPEILAAFLPEDPSQRASSFQLPLLRAH